MNSGTEQAHQTTVATRVAGEDIHPRDFVSVSYEIFELPSYLWCCDTAATPKDELVRLRCMPRESGEPFKVITVCLPFVYVQRSSGKLATFDIRKHQLVKLDRAVGKKVWKRMRTNQ